MFTKDDFNGCKYNVFGLSDRKYVIDVWPELKRYKEFGLDFNENAISNDKIHRYALLMYQHSPIHDTIPEFYKRKRYCAEQAGFTVSEGKFATRIEDVLLCKDERANKVAIRVMRLTNNVNFQQFVVFNEALTKEMSKLIDPSSSGKTKEIRENIKNLSKDIKELESELLLEDINSNLLDLVYTEVDLEVLRLKPEDFADATVKGEYDTLAPNPYKRAKIKKKKLE